MTKEFCVAYIIQGTIIQRKSTRKKKWRIYVGVIMHPKEKQEHLMKNHQSASISSGFWSISRELVLALFGLSIQYLVIIVEKH